MHPLQLAYSKIIECCDDISQFVDMPEVIFVLAIVTLLVSLSLLRQRS
jgi:hypothetical protein